jgi:hypothetical protein
MGAMINEMAQKTLFRTVVGDSPTSRVIELLITGREIDYSLSDIARNSSVGWTSLHRIWSSLEKNKIVVHTRVIGKAKMYKLNMENNIAKGLVKLYDTILLKENKKVLQRKIKIKA